MARKVKDFPLLTSMTGKLVAIFNATTGKGEKTTFESFGTFLKSIFYDKTQINALVTSSFAGKADTSENPGTPLSNVFYRAMQVGTYTHFHDEHGDAIVVATGEQVDLLYTTEDGYWTKIAVTLAPPINNLDTTDPGDYLDAAQGPVIKSSLTENAGVIQINATALQTGFQEIAVSITNGFYISSTADSNQGKPVASDDYQYSGFSKVNVGARYYYTGALGGVAPCIAVYDANKAFLAVLYNSVIAGRGTTITADDEVLLPAIPSGGAYIRASSRYQNTSNSGYVGGMRKLSITDRPKALSFQNKIDGNVEEITKLYGVPTNRLTDQSVLKQGKMWDAVTTGGEITDATRAYISKQPVIPNRNYTTNRISGFLLFLDANDNIIAYYNGAATLPLLDNLAIPRLTSPTYDTVNFVLSYRTPWNCYKITANSNSQTSLSTQPAYDAWKAAVTVVTDVKGTQIKLSAHEQSVQNAAAKIAEIFEDPTDITNRSLYGYGQKWEPVSKGLVNDTTRGNTGMQPVTAGKTYTISGISRYLVCYNTTGEAPVIIEYFALPTDSTNSNMSAYPRTNIVNGGNYDTTTKTLTFTPREGTTAVIANNTGTFAGISDFNAWRDASTLETTVSKEYISQGFIDPDVLKSSVSVFSPIKNFPVDLAHRGLHAAGTVSPGGSITPDVGGLIAPEDSLAAVLWAYLCGYEWVECDVQVTGDGFLVICHGATMNETFTDINGDPILGTINISDYTFADLRANYKAKSPFAKYQLPIPSLADYCQLCSKLRMKAFIEPKEGMLTRNLAAVFLTTIANSSIGLDNVVIHSFDAAALGYIRELNKEVALCYIQANLTTPVQASFDTCLQLNSKYLMCSESKVTQTVMDLATRNNVRIAVYTPVPGRRNALIDLGVSIFVADYMAPPETSKGTKLQELFSGVSFTGFSYPSAPVGGVVTLGGGTMTTTPVTLTKLSACSTETDVKGSCTIRIKVNTDIIATISVNPTNYERIVLGTHNSNVTGPMFVEYSGTGSVKDARVIVKEF